MSANGKKRDKSFITLLVLIILCACLMIAAITTLGIGLSNGDLSDNPQTEQPGNRGSVWHKGKGAPANDVGVEGDFYYDEDTGNVYCKSATGWGTPLLNMQGNGDKVPNIRDGYWYLGDEPTDVRAEAADGITPEIGLDGYWYFGDTKSQFKAFPTMTSGTEAPNDDDGAIGDFYVQTAEGATSFYQKGTDKKWKLVVTVEAAPATDVNGSVWHAGTGAPTATSPEKANVGDFYLDSQTGNVYMKGASGWGSPIGNLHMAPAPQEEVAWYFGEGDPNSITDDGNHELYEQLQNANEGDFYLDNTTGEIYKKGASKWDDTGISMKGESGSAGNKWYSGTGAPTAETPSLKDQELHKGDVYFDTENHLLYTYDGSAWGDGVPFGATGATGDAQKWLKGAGNPNDHTPVADSKNGDFYIDTTTGKLYQRQDAEGVETWTDLGITIQGSAGNPGNKWYYGTVAPQDNHDLDGIEFHEGDIYYDTANHNLYTYGTYSGVAGWGEPVSFGAQGEQGNPGTKWFVGKGAPEEVAGSEIGDYYLDGDSGKLYQKQAKDDSFEWKDLELSLKGTPGTPGTPGDPGARGSKWFSNTGAPDESKTAPQDELQAGDVYFDTENKTLYVYDGSSWGDGTSLKGDKGDDADPAVPGAKWYVGDVAPADILEDPNHNLYEALTDANEGDLYLNGTDGKVYTKGADGSWTDSGVTIKGKDGNKWYSGDKAPTESPESLQGVTLQDGDVYFDTDSKTLYTYKSGEWDEGTSLKGDPGLRGTQWYHGTVAPSAEDPAEAKDGDYYFDTSSNIIYIKEAGEWKDLVDLTPADPPEPFIGDDGNWHIGDTNTGIPARGEKGEDGLTPYIGEDNHWHIGDQDFGPAVGADGRPGDTPYINDDGNWQIGARDTGVKAAGEDGKNGTVWHSDAGVPVTHETDVDGEIYTGPFVYEGDFYLDTLTGDVYVLEGDAETGTWEKIVTLRDTITNVHGAWYLNGKPTGFYVSTWHTGEGDPNALKVSGVYGDLYLDTLTGDVYVSNAALGEESASWTKKLNIKGERGNYLYSGKGEPVLVKEQEVEDEKVYVADAKNGDMYLNTDTGDIYQMQEGAWVNIFTTKGAKGDRGSKWFNGKDVPTNVEGAVVGDYYFETKHGIIYTLASVDAEGVQHWEPVNSDDPLAGTKWLSGEVDPSEAVDDLKTLLDDANDWDVYFNTVEKTIWQKTPQPSGTSEWKLLGKLTESEDRGTVWYYGTYDPIIDAEDEGFLKATAGHIKGDFYLQTYYPFSGYTGFRIYIFETDAEGNNGKWNMHVDMRSDITSTPKYEIPNYDALRAFRDSVNGVTGAPNSYENDGAGNKVTVTLTGRVTIPDDENFGMIGETEDTPFKGIFDGGEAGLYIEGLKDPLFGYLDGAEIRNLHVKGTLDELTLSTFALGDKTSLLTNTFGIAKEIKGTTTIKNVKLELSNANGTVLVEWDGSGNVSVTITGNDPATHRARASANADDYMLVIRGQKLLLGKADFTFEHVKFEDNLGQNSYIDVTEAKSLTLKDCYADVNPIEACERNADGTPVMETVGLTLSGTYGKDRAGYAAFIVSRPSSADRTNALKLTVENSVILAAQSTSTNDAATSGRQGCEESMAILINTNLETATITGNIFGTAAKPYAKSAVKLTSMAANATIKISDNKVYGANQYTVATTAGDVTYNTEFAAFALSDSDSSVYTATIEANAVNVDKISEMPVEFLSVTGTGHAQVYFVGASNQYNTDGTLGHYGADVMLRSVKAEENGFDFVAFFAELNGEQLAKGRVYLGSNFGAEHQFKPADLQNKSVDGTSNHDVWIIDLAFEDPLGFTQHVADYTTNYYVNNAFGLGSFRDMVNAEGTYEGKTPNSFSEMTVVTTQNIDLAEANITNWTPIGTKAHPFSGKFTTKYLDTPYAIKNLVIDVTADDYVANDDTDTNIGLFGYVSGSAELYDIEIAGVNINAWFMFPTDKTRVGALVANAGSAKVHDVKVSGDIQITSHRVHMTGTVIGQSSSNLSNITVDAAKGSCIKMYDGGQQYYIGGIVGHTGSTHTFTGLNVKNLKIMGGSQVGGLIGLIFGGSTVSNAMLENVYLYNGDIEYNNTTNNTAQQVGAVAGGWIEGSGDTITIQNVKFQGTDGTAGVIERGEHKSALSNGNQYISKFLWNGGYVGGHHENFKGGNVDYSDSENNIYALIDTDLYYRNGDYEIMSAHGLQRFADLVTKNGTYHDSVEGHMATLMADIDLSVLKDENGEWLTAKDKVPAGYENTAYKYVLTPIGDATNTFKGTFDGNDKTITGLTAALFGYTNGATVKNLVLEGVNINVKGTTSDSIGALINVADETLIENISVSGSVIGNGHMAVGGVVGMTTTRTNPQALLKNVSFEGTVQGEGEMSMVGGIAGVTTVSIEKATVKATVAGIGTYSAGGIFGAAMEIRSGTTSVDETVHIKSVTVEGSVTGAAWVGGVAGGVHTADFYDVMVKADLTKTYKEGDEVLYARGIGVVTGHTESQVKLGAVYFSGTIDNQYNTDNLNYLVYNYGLVGDGSWRNMATDEWASGKSVIAPATVHVEAADATGENATLGGNTFTAVVNAHIAATDLDLTATFGNGTVAHGNVGALVTVNSDIGLASVAELVNHGITFEGETVMVGKGIDMTSYQTNWVGIGNETHAFEGTFNGRDNEIDHLYGPLFGNTSGATVQNVTLGGAVMQSNAALIKNAADTTVTGVTIDAFVQNVDGNAVIKASDVAAAPFGIVGTMEGKTAITSTNIKIAFKLENVTFTAEVGKTSDTVVTYTGNSTDAKANEVNVLNNEYFVLKGFVNEGKAMAADYTFTNLHFVGDSFIKVVAANVSVSVKDSYIDVLVKVDSASQNANTGAWGFIEGKSAYKLIFENNIAFGGSSRTGGSGALIIGWSALLDGSSIKNNQFGSEDKPYTNYQESVIKMLEVPMDSEHPLNLPIEGNTFYMSREKAASDDGTILDNPLIAVTVHRMASGTVHAGEIEGYDYTLNFKNNKFYDVTPDDAANTLDKLYPVSVEANRTCTNGKVFFENTNKIVENGTERDFHYDDIRINGYNHDKDGVKNVYDVFAFVGYNVVYDGDKITKGDFILGGGADRFHATDTNATEILKAYVKEGCEENIHIVIGEQFGRRLSDILGGNDNTYYNFSLVGLNTFVSLVNTGAWSGKGAIVKLADELNGSHVLDLTSYTSWTPIGNNEHAFKGTFDGSYTDADGNEARWTITHLTYNGTGDLVGFFGHTDGATLTNLIFTDANISSEANTSRISGILVANAEHNVAISNIEVRDSSLTNYVGDAGAIAGHVEDGVVSDILVTALTISTTSTPTVGAVAGVAKNCTLNGIQVGVTNGESDVLVSDGSVVITGSSKVGGVVGVAEDGVTIGTAEKPVYSGAILKASAVTESTTLQIGGIVGALTVNEGATGEFNVTNAHFDGTLTRVGWQNASSTKYENYGLVGGYTTEKTGTVTIASSTLDVIHFENKDNTADQFVQDTDWDDAAVVTSEYKITGPEGFKFFRDQVNGGNTYAEYDKTHRTINREIVHLMADIDLNNEEWEPIGYNAEDENVSPYPPQKPVAYQLHAVFQGVFTAYKATADKTVDIMVKGEDGAEHDSGYDLNPNAYTISNLKVNGHNDHSGAGADVGGNSMGLFGRTQLAEIKNLNVVNAHVTGNLAVGVIVGTGDGTSFSNITVANAVVKGHSYVGGLVGHNDCNDGVWDIGTEQYKDNVVVGLEGQAFPEKIMVEEKPYFDYGAKLGGLAGYSIAADYTNNTVAYANLTAYKDLGGLVGIDNTGIPTEGENAGEYIDYTENTVKNVELVIKRSGYTTGDPDGMAGYDTDYEHVDASQPQYVDWMVGRLKAAADKAAKHGVNVEGEPWNNRKIDVHSTLGDTENAKGLVYDNNAWHIVTPEGLKTFKEVNDSSTSGGSWNGSSVGKAFSGMTVYLDCDVDLSETAEPASYRARAARSAETPNWKPIGGNDSNFQGTFDGQGHSIKNMYVAEPNFEGGKSYLGFFGTLSNNSAVKNLVFENPTVTGSTYAGVLAGRAGSGPNSIEISNITIKGDVRVESTGAFVGGLVGHLDAMSVKDIHIQANDGSLVKGNYNVGGIGGYWVCYNTEPLRIDNSDVNIDVEGNDWVGGVVGRVTGAVASSNVTAKGTIKGTGTEASVSGFGSKANEDSVGAVAIDHFHFEGDLVADTDKYVRPIFFMGSEQTSELHITDSVSKVTNATEEELPEGLFYGQVANHEGEVLTGYIIENVTGFKAFADLVNNGKDFENETVILTADINLADLEGAWTPIGKDTNHRFMGTFDGLGHTVSNIKVSGVKNLGLFGVVGDINKSDITPAIKNLVIGGKNTVTITDAAWNDVYGYRNDSGLLVGYAAKTTFENITYDASASVTVTAETYTLVDGKYQPFVGCGSAIGGLVGASQTCTYNNINLNCAVTVTAESGVDVGGLIGLSMHDTLTGVKISSCTVRANFEVGGVIGKAYGNVSLTNVTVEQGSVWLCYNWLYLDKEGAPITSQDSYFTTIGGLVGVAYDADKSTLSVDGCSFTGTLIRNNTALQLDGVETPDLVNYGLVGTANYNGTAVETVSIKSTSIVVESWTYDGVYSYSPAPDYKLQGLYGEDGTFAPESLSISSAEGLSYFAKLVNKGNDFADVTVTLEKDIDLGGVNWTAIGTTEHPFSGHFDGKGHTISNLAIESADHPYVGLFGFVGYKAGGDFHQNISVENFTLKNVKINVAVGYVGAVVGHANGHTGDSTKITFSDITVTGNVNVTTSGDFAGGFAGHLFNVDLNNIHVENVTGKVSSSDSSEAWSGQAGGIAGHVSGVAANDIVSEIDVEGQWAGAFAGCLEGAAVTNATLSGNITGHTVYVGAVAGSISDGTNTLNNVHYVGTVTTDAAEGFNLDNHGIIGKAYASATLNVTESSVALSDVVKGYSQTTEWDETGKATYSVEISAVDGLKYFRDLVNGGNTYEGVTVTLTAEINLSGEASWTPIGGTKGHLQGKAWVCENPFKGTFDGKNNTIKNLTINDANLDYAGLFGYIVNGTIENLYMENVNINAHNFAGAVVGSVHDGKSSLSNITVTNVTVTGVSDLGGLVGNFYQGHGENLTVEGNVQITGNYKLGGLAGAYSYCGSGANFTVNANEGSSVTATHKEDDLEGDSVGGVIGFTAEETMRLTNLSASNLTVSGTRSVGGIVGKFGQKTSLSDVTLNNVTVDNTETSLEYAQKRKDCLNVGGVVGEALTGSSITVNGSQLTDVTVNTLFVYPQPAESVLAVNGGKYVPAQVLGAVRGGNTGVTLNLSGDFSGVTVNSSIQIDSIVDGRIREVSVATAAQLAFIPDHYGDGELFAAAGEGLSFTINLLNDIDMDDLATEGKPYEWQAMSGHWVTFNGNGHAIKNLNAIPNANGQTGLFGYSGGCKINGLTIDGFTGYGSQVGAFAGNGTDGATLVDCHIAGKINITYVNRTWGTDYHESVGGVGAAFGVTFASIAHDVTIENGCVVTITLQDEMVTIWQPNDYVLGYMPADCTATHSGNNGEIKVVQGTADVNDYAQVYSKEYDGEYVVYSLAGLEYFRGLVNSGTSFAGKTVALHNDINLQEVENGGGTNWEPIGSAANPFFGTFDGREHTISNLVNTSGDSELGLFGFASQYEGVNGGQVVKAYIKNLKLVNVTLKGASHVAGVVGTLVYGGLENITVSGNIHVEANTHAAGVVGLCYGELKDVHVDGANGVMATDGEPSWNIHATQKIAGGIVGGYAGSTLSDLSAEHISVFVDGVNADVPESTDVGYAGGIAGVVVETEVDATGLEVRGVMVGAGATNDTEAQQQTAAQNAGALLGAVVGGNVTVSDYYVSTDSEIVDEKQQTVNKTEGEEQVPEVGNDAPVVGGKDADKVIPADQVIWLYTDTEGLIQVMKGSKGDYSNSTLTKIEVLDETGLANLTEAIKKNIAADVYLQKGKTYDMTGKTRFPIDTYSGHFYGNNATIKGMTSSYVFYTLKNDAYVENLTLIGKSALASSALIGSSSDRSAGHKIVIDNVDIYGLDVYGTGDATISGSAIYFSSVTSFALKETEDVWSQAELLIKNCENHADLKGSGNRACAFIGTIYGMTTRFEDCVNYGNLTNSNASGNGTHAAAFVGYTMRNTSLSENNADFVVELIRCRNEGDITLTRGAGGTSACNVGGLLSTQQGGHGFYYEDCSNSGKITCNGGNAGPNVGGLLGRTNGFKTTFINPVNTGDVVGTSESSTVNVGGIIGSKDAGATTITGGSVKCTVTALETSGSGFAGALAGGGVSNITVDGFTAEIAVNAKNAAHEDNHYLFSSTTAVAAGAVKNTTLSLVYASDEEGKAGFTQDFSWDAEGAVTVGDYHIYNLAGLKAFRDSVNAGNNYAGLTVLLEDDINLNNEEWKTIASKDSGITFAGVFDGKDHIISNLLVSHGEDGGDSIRTNEQAGLFGSANGATIMNLTIDGANVTAGRYVGVLAGLSNGATLINIHIKNGTVNGTHFVAALTGYANSGLVLQNCSVEGCTVNGVHYVDEAPNNNYNTGDKIGGLVGQVAGDTLIITGCTVSGTTIRAWRDVGALAGMLNNDGTVTGNTITGVTIYVDHSNADKNQDPNATLRYGEVFGRYGKGDASEQEEAMKAVNVVKDVTIEFVGFDAKIGENYYHTLQDAFRAVKEGETVELLNDLTVTSEDLQTYTGESRYSTFIDLYFRSHTDAQGHSYNGTVPANFTFDGKGHTITSELTMNAGYLFYFGPQDGVTFKNFTIEGDARCAFYIMDDTTNFTFDSVNVRGNYFILLWLNSNPQVTLKNCNIENTAERVINGYGGTTIWNGDGVVTLVNTTIDSIAANFYKNDFTTMVDVVGEGHAWGRVYIDKDSVLTDGADQPWLYGAAIFEDEAVPQSYGWTAVVMTPELMEKFPGLANHTRNGEPETHWFSNAQDASDLIAHLGINA